MDRIAGFGPVDGGSIPPKLIKKMELGNKPLTSTQSILLLLILLSPILFFAGIMYFIYLQIPESPPDFYEGSLSVEFCTEKCGDLDYLSSINNTKYQFISCECVVGIKLGDGKYSSVASVKSVEYFFDSETFEETTKKDILKKINEI